MGNERITEDYVRSKFKNDPLFKDVKFEEQRTKNKNIRELLKKASKKGTGKPGAPEFIITFPELIDAVIIIECKADLRNHENIKNKKSNPEKFAIDGVLHYSKFLKHKFDVIAIAVSGERIDNLKVSHFIISKEGKTKRTDDTKILSIYDYLQIFNQEEIAENLKEKNLLLFASELNQELYNYSVPENERATIVSGILIALQNKSFRNSYHYDKKPEDLVFDLLEAIRRVLKVNNMAEKEKILIGEYSKIAQSNKLAISEFVRNIESGEDEKNTILRDVINELKNKVFPYTKYEHIGYDILGQFYSEFISYVYGDKKLGLVLTPQHVLELFTDIADVNVNNKIYDNCCGTAGFLIKSMQKMLYLCGNDTDKKNKIKKNQLIGVEERSDMFTYACSNMMMRGDGKSNIYLGDSLSNKIIEEIKKLKPDIGFLNPPYSTNISELEFIYYNLECLQKNGTCVAIIPMNCVLSQSGRDYEWKKKLLEKHTLDAVFSMPDELFNPAASTVTAIVVFRAHNTHKSDVPSYFGYWKDDGFIKLKHLGRVDYYNKWESIKKEWISNYRSKNEVVQHSVKQCVTAEDEWCAEAYMETDYSEITEEDFIGEIRKYIAFKIMNGDLNS